jgi:hypothetical protein
MLVEFDGKGGKAPVALLGDAVTVTGGKLDVVLAGTSVLDSTELGVAG